MRMNAVTNLNGTLGGVLNTSAIGGQNNISTNYMNSSQAAAAIAANRQTNQFQSQM